MLSRLFKTLKKSKMASSETGTSDKESIADDSLTKSQTIEKTYEIVTLTSASESETEEEEEWIVTMESDDQLTWRVCESIKTTHITHKRTRKKTNGSEIDDTVDGQMTPETQAVATATKQLTASDEQNIQQGRHEKQICHTMQEDQQIADTREETYHLDTKQNVENKSVTLREHDDWYLIALNESQNEKYELNLEKSNLAGAGSDGVKQRQADKTAESDDHLSTGKVQDPSGNVIELGLEAYEIDATNEATHRSATVGQNTDGIQDLSLYRKIDIQRDNDHSTKTVTDSTIEAVPQAPSLQSNICIEGSSLISVTKQSSKNLTDICKEKVELHPESQNDSFTFEQTQTSPSQNLPENTILKHETLAQSKPDDVGIQQTMDENDPSIETTSEETNLQPTSYPSAVEKKYSTGTTDKTSEENINLPLNHNSKEKYSDVSLQETKRDNEELTASDSDRIGNARDNITDLTQDHKLRYISDQQLEDFSGNSVLVLVNDAKSYHTSHSAIDMDLEFVKKVTDTDTAKLESKISGSASDDTDHDAQMTADESLIPQSCAEHVFGPIATDILSTDEASASITMNLEHDASLMQSSKNDQIRDDVHVIIPTNTSHSDIDMDLELVEIVTDTDTTKLESQISGSASDDTDHDAQMTAEESLIPQSCVLGPIATDIISKDEDSASITTNLDHDASLMQSSENGQIRDDVHVIIPTNTEDGCIDTINCSLSRELNHDSEDIYSVDQWGKEAVKPKAFEEIPNTDEYSLRENTDTDKLLTPEWPECTGDSLENINRKQTNIESTSSAIKINTTSYQFTDDILSEQDQTCNTLATDILSTDEASASITTNLKHDASLIQSSENSQIQDDFHVIIPEWPECTGDSLENINRKQSNIGSASSTSSVIKISTTSSQFTDDKDSEQDQTCNTIDDKGNHTNEVENQVHGKNSLEEKRVQDSILENMVHQHFSDDIANAYTQSLLDTPALATYTDECCTSTHIEEEKGTREMQLPVTYTDHSVKSFIEEPIVTMIAEVNSDSKSEENSEYAAIKDKSTSNEDTLQKPQGLEFISKFKMDDSKPVYILILTLHDRDISDLVDIVKDIVHKEEHVKKSGVGIRGSADAFGTWHEPKLAVQIDDDCYALVINDYVTKNSQYKWLDSTASHIEGDTDPHTGYVYEHFPYIDRLWDLDEPTTTDDIVFIMNIWGDYSYQMKSKSSKDWDCKRIAKLILNQPKPKDQKAKEEHLLGEKMVQTKSYTEYQTHKINLEETDAQNDDEHIHQVALDGQEAESRLPANTVDTDEDYVDRLLEEKDQFTDSSSQALTENLKEDNNEIPDARILNENDEYRVSSETDQFTRAEEKFAVPPKDEYQRVEENGQKLDLTDTRLSSESQEGRESIDQLQCQADIKSEIDKNSNVIISHKQDHAHNQEPNSSTKQRIKSENESLISLQNDVNQSAVHNILQTDTDTAVGCNESHERTGTPLANKVHTLEGHDHSHCDKNAKFPSDEETMIKQHVTSTEGNNQEQSLEKNKELLICKQKNGKEKDFEQDTDKNEVISITEAESIDDSNQQGEQVCESSASERDVMSDKIDFAKHEITKSSNTDSTSVSHVDVDELHKDDDEKGLDNIHSPDFHESGTRTSQTNTDKIQIDQKEGGDTQALVVGVVIAETSSGKASAQPINDTTTITTGQEPDEINEKINFERTNEHRYSTEDEEDATPKPCDQELMEGPAVMTKAEHTLKTQITDESIQEDNDGAEKPIVVDEEMIKPSSGGDGLGHYTTFVTHANVDDTMATKQHQLDKSFDHSHSPSLQESDPGILQTSADKIQMDQVQEEDAKGLVGEEIITKTLSGKSSAPPINDTTTITTGQEPDEINEKINLERTNEHRYSTEDEVDATPKPCDQELMEGPDVMTKAEQTSKTQITDESIQEDNDRAEKPIVVDEEMIKPSSGGDGLGHYTTFVTHANVDDTMATKQHQLDKSFDHSHSPSLQESDPGILQTSADKIQMDQVEEEDAKGLVGEEIITKTLSGKSSAPPENDTTKKKAIQEPEIDATTDEGNTHTKEAVNFKGTKEDPHSMADKVDVSHKGMGEEVTVGADVMSTTEWTSQIQITNESIQREPIAVEEEMLKPSIDKDALEHFTASMETMSNENREREKKRDKQKGDDIPPVDKDTEEIKQIDEGQYEQNEQSLLMCEEKTVSISTRPKIELVQTAASVGCVLPGQIARVKDYDNNERDTTNVNVLNVQNKTLKPEDSTSLGSKVQSENEHDAGYRSSISKDENAHKEDASSRSQEIEINSNPEECITDHDQIEIIEDIENNQKHETDKCPPVTPEAGLRSKRLIEMGKEQRTRSNVSLTIDSEKPLNIFVLTTNHNTNCLSVEDVQSYIEHASPDESHESLGVRGSTDAFGSWHEPKLAVKVADGCYVLLINDHIPRRSQYKWLDVTGETAPADIDPKTKYAYEHDRYVDRVCDFEECQAGNIALIFDSWGDYSQNVSYSSLQDWDIEKLSSILSKCRYFTKYSFEEHFTRINITVTETTELIEEIEEIVEVKEKECEDHMHNESLQDDSLQSGLSIEDDNTSAAVQYSGADADEDRTLYDRSSTNQDDINGHKYNVDGAQSKESSLPDLLTRSKEYDTDNRAKFDDANTEKTREGDVSFITDENTRSGHVADINRLHAHVLLKSAQKVLEAEPDVGTDNKQSMNIDLEKQPDKTSDTLPSVSSYTVSMGLTSKGSKYNDNDKEEVIEIIQDNIAQFATPRASIRITGQSVGLDECNLDIKENVGKSGENKLWVADTQKGHQVVPDSERILDVEIMQQAEREETCKSLTEGTTKDTTLSDIDESTLFADPSGDLPDCRTIEVAYASSARTPPRAKVSVTSEAPEIQQDSHEKQYTESDELQKPVKRKSHITVENSKDDGNTCESFRDKTNKLSDSKIVSNENERKDDKEESELGDDNATEKSRGIEPGQTISTEKRALQKNPTRVRDTEQDIHKQSHTEAEQHFDITQKEGITGLTAVTLTEKNQSKETDLDEIYEKACLGKNTQTDEESRLNADGTNKHTDGKKGMGRGFEKQHDRISRIDANQPDLLPIDIEIDTLVVTERDVQRDVQSEYNESKFLSAHSKEISDYSGKKGKDVEVPVPMPIDVTKTQAEKSIDSNVSEMKETDTKRTLKVSDKQGNKIPDLPDEDNNTERPAAIDDPIGDIIGHNICEEVTLVTENVQSTMATPCDLQLHFDSSCKEGTVDLKLKDEQHESELRKVDIDVRPSSKDLSLREDGSPTKATPSTQLTWPEKGDLNFDSHVSKEVYDVAHERPVEIEEKRIQIQSYTSYKDSKSVSMNDDQPDKIQDCVREALPTEDEKGGAREHLVHDIAYNASIPNSEEKQQTEKPIRKVSATEVEFLQDSNTSYIKSITFNTRRVSSDYDADKQRDLIDGSEMDRKDGIEKPLSEEQEVIDDIHKEAVAAVSNAQIVDYEQLNYDTNEAADKSAKTQTDLGSIPSDYTMNKSCDLMHDSKNEGIKDSVSSEELVVIENIQKHTVTAAGCAPISNDEEFNYEKGESSQNSASTHQAIELDDAFMGSTKVEPGETNDQHDHKAEVEYGSVIVESEKAIDQHAHKGEVEHNSSMLEPEKTSDQHYHKTEIKHDSLKVESEKASDQHAHRAEVEHDSLKVESEKASDQHDHKAKVVHDTLTVGSGKTRDQQDHKAEYGHDGSKAKLEKASDQHDNRAEVEYDGLKVESERGSVQYDQKAGAEYDSSMVESEKASDQHDHEAEAEYDSSMVESEKAGDQHDHEDEAEYDSSMVKSEKSSDQHDHEAEVEHDGSIVESEKASDHHDHRAEVEHNGSMLEPEKASDQHDHKTEVEDESSIVESEKASEQHDHRVQVENDSLKVESEKGSDQYDHEAKVVHDSSIADSEKARVQQDHTAEVGHGGSIAESEKASHQLDHKAEVEHDVSIAESEEAIDQHAHRAAAEHNDSMLEPEKASDKQDHKTEVEDDSSIVESVKASDQHDHKVEVEPDSLQLKSEYDSSVVESEKASDQHDHKAEVEYGGFKVESEKVSDQHDHKAEAEYDSLMVESEKAGDQHDHKAEVEHDSLKVESIKGSDQHDHETKVVHDSSIADSEKARVQQDHKTEFGHGGSISESEKASHQLEPEKASDQHDHKTEIEDDSSIVESEKASDQHDHEAKVEHDSLKVESEKGSDQHDHKAEVEYDGLKVESERGSDQHAHKAEVEHDSLKVESKKGSDQHDHEAKVVQYSSIAESEKAIDQQDHTAEVGHGGLISKSEKSSDQHDHKAEVEHDGSIVESEKASDQQDHKAEVGHGGSISESEKSSDQHDHKAEVEHDGSIVESEKASDQNGHEAKVVQYSSIAESEKARVQQDHTAEVGHGGSIAESEKSSDQHDHKAEVEHDVSIAESEEAIDQHAHRAAAEHNDSMLEPEKASDKQDHKTEVEDDSSIVESVKASDQHDHKVEVEPDSLQQKAEYDSSVVESEKASDQHDHKAEVEYGGFKVESEKVSDQHDHKAEAEYDSSMVESEKAGDQHDHKAEVEHDSLKVESIKGSDQHDHETKVVHDSSIADSEKARVQQDHKTEFGHGGSISESEKASHQLEPEKASDQHDHKTEIEDDSSIVESEKASDQHDHETKVEHDSLKVESEKGSDQHDHKAEVEYDGLKVESERGSDQHAHKAEVEHDSLKVESEKGSDQHDHEPKVVQYSSIAESEKAIDQQDHTAEVGHGGLISKSEKSSDQHDHKAEVEHDGSIVESEKASDQQDHKAEVGHGGSISESEKSSDQHDHKAEVEHDGSIVESEKASDQNGHEAKVVQYSSIAESEKARVQQDHTAEVGHGGLISKSEKSSDQHDQTEIEDDSSIVESEKASDQHDHEAKVEHDSLKVESERGSDQHAHKAEVEHDSLKVESEKGSDQHDHEAKVVQYSSIAESEKASDQQDHKAEVGHGGSISESEKSSDQHDHKAEVEHDGSIVESEKASDQHAHKAEVVQDISIVGSEKARVQQDHTAEVGHGGLISKSEKSSDQHDHKAEVEHDGSIVAPEKASDQQDHKAEVGHGGSISESEKSSDQHDHKAEVEHDGSIVESEKASDQHAHKAEVVQDISIVGSEKARDQHDHKTEFGHDGLKAESEKASDQHDHKDEVEYDGLKVESEKVSDQHDHKAEVEYGGFEVESERGSDQHDHNAEAEYDSSMVESEKAGDQYDHKAKVEHDSLKVESKKGSDQHDHEVKYVQDSSIAESEKATDQQDHTAEAGHGGSIAESEKSSDQHDHRAEVEHDVSIAESEEAIDQHAHRAAAEHNDSMLEPEKASYKHDHKTEVEDDSSTVESVKASDQHDHKVEVEPDSLQVESEKCSDQYDHEAEVEQDRSIVELVKGSDQHDHKAGAQHDNLTVESEKASDQYDQKAEVGHDSSKVEMEKISDQHDNEDKAEHDIQIVESEKASDQHEYNENEVLQDSSKADSREASELYEHKAKDVEHDSSKTESETLSEPHGDKEEVIELDNSNVDDYHVHKANELVHDSSTAESKEASELYIHKLKEGVHDSSITAAQAVTTDNDLSMFAPAVEDPEAYVAEDIKDYVIEKIIMPSLAIQHNLRFIDKTKPLYILAIKYGDMNTTEESDVETISKFLLANTTEAEGSKAYPNFALRGSCPTFGEWGDPIPATRIKDGFYAVLINDFIPEGNQYKWLSTSPVMAVNGDEDPATGFIYEPRPFVDRSCDFAKHPSTDKIVFVSNYWGDYSCQAEHVPTDQCNTDNLLKLRRNVETMMYTVL